MVRDTGSAPPYRTVLVPYSPVPKASGNLGAKPLEITLGFAVLGTTNGGWNRRVSIVVVACLSTKGTVRKERLPSFLLAW